MVCSSWIASFAVLPPPFGRPSPRGPGFGSVALSIPLGLIFGRPDPPFSRAISSRSVATSRRSSASSSHCFTTKLLSSVCARRSRAAGGDRKSTRLNSSHLVISYAVFCLQKKKRRPQHARRSCHAFRVWRHPHLLPPEPRHRVSFFF